MAKFVEKVVACAGNQQKVELVAGVCFSCGDPAQRQKFVVSEEILLCHSLSCEQEAGAVLFDPNQLVFVY